METSGKALRSGHTKSCGCIHKETASKTFKKHGYSDKSIHNIWISMKQRCRNENSKAYKRYGARGINYCDRWGVFENFLEDMGERPSLSYSLERVDNNKGYCPDNCIWADDTTQARNKGNYKNNKTGIKGVFKLEKTNKYHANIRVNKKLLFLGSYRTLEEAKKARLKAENEYFNN
jgi:hypothetical protein